MTELLDRQVLFYLFILILFLFLRLSISNLLDAPSTTVALEAGG